MLGASRLGVARRAYRETGGAAQNMSMADMTAGDVQAVLEVPDGSVDVVVVAARAHEGAGS